MGKFYDQVQENGKKNPFIIDDAFMKIKETASGVAAPENKVRIAEFLEANKHHLTDPKNFDWLKNTPKFDPTIINKLGDGADSALNGLFGRG